MSGETVDVHLQEAVKGKIIFFNLAETNCMFIAGVCLKNDCERGKGRFQSCVSFLGTDTITSQDNGK